MTKTGQPSRLASLLRIALVLALIVTGVVINPATASATIADKRNDYDRDGVSDYLALDIWGCMHRYSGNGSGGFTSPVQIGCGWNEYRNLTSSGQYADTYAVAAPGDINGDGNGDLAAITSGRPGSEGCLYRWLGNGNGGFQAGTLVGCGWGPYRDSLTGAGDLDGDGYGDLVALNNADELLRWSGNGSGGFRSAVRIGFSGWWGYGDSLNGVGDINRDGRADLVSINRTQWPDQCLYRFLNNGKGGVSSGVQVGCGWANFQPTGMGDLNRDGIGDMVAINVQNLCMYRYLGTGNGGFSSGVQLGCGWDNRWYTIS